MKNLLLLIITLNVISVNAQTSLNPLNQTQSEDDFSLPTWVTQSTNSGLYDVPSVPDALSLLVRWKTLNPAEDVYDWSIIDNAVATNQPFFLRIWAADVLHCPAWVGNKYPNIPILFNDGGNGDSQYFDLFEISNSQFYAMWHPGFTTEFKKFLLAFKAKNYFANPNLKFMYCPGAWRYNEWNLGQMVDEINANAPITPTNFVLWFKQHLDDYADATNGFPSKMVFTGYGRIENPADYGSANSNWFFAANNINNGDNILTSYAVSIGMGVREGAQEYFNSSSDCFAWGSPSETINNISYQTVDDNHPLHNNINKITGTENEAFCDPQALSGGVCSYYHLKMSTLKALQLRVNWLNTRDNLVAIAPNIYEYSRKTMNKTASNSPDAWAVLRQSYDPLFTNTPPALPNPIINSPLWTSRVTLPFRNWEKWLKQREVLPEGKVVPTYQLNSLTNFDFFNLKAEEALRTDRINGGNYIYFDVNNSFIQGGNNDIQIKVTYLDNFSGNWWIEYDANLGAIYKQSSQIVNQNNNTWKTVTFNIQDAGFNNRQNGGMDFRIYNGGTNDLAARFVRIIKNNNPSLGISENIELPSKIKIFPNPVNSTFKIETELKISELTIFDIIGKEVLNFSKINNFIDISKLSNGIYILNFKTENGLIFKEKIVKK